MNVEFLIDQYLYSHNLSARLGIADMLRKNSRYVGLIVTEYIYHFVTLHISALFTRLQKNILHIGSQVFRITRLHNYCSVLFSIQADPGRN